MSVNAVEHHIGRAINAPAGKGQALAQVQHLRVRPLKAVVEKADQRVVEPDRIGTGARIEYLETVDAERLHEAGQVGMFQRGAVGQPHGIAWIDGIDLHFPGSDRVSYGVHRQVMVRAVNQQC